MSIQTLDMRRLKKRNVNVYEMCLVIASRAREINSERNKKRRENEVFDDVDLYDEVDIYDRELMQEMKFEKEVNPTVVAQNEFFEGKVKPVYREE